MLIGKCLFFFLIVILVTVIYHTYIPCEVFVLTLY